MKNKILIMIMTKPLHFSSYLRVILWITENFITILIAIFIQSFVSMFKDRKHKFKAFNYFPNTKNVTNEKRELFIRIQCCKHFVSINLTYIIMEHLWFLLLFELWKIYIVWSLRVESIRQSHYNVWMKVPNVIMIISLNRLYYAGTFWTVGKE